MFQYSNTQNSATNQYKRRRNRPTSVAFNGYFNSLMITSDYDVRMYNCYTGKLEKVFVGQRIIQSDNEKINGFSEGALQRKYYVADHKGTIDCFNSLNGEKLKVVNEPQEEQKSLKKIADLLNVNLNAKDNEMPTEDPITCMTYIGNDNRLIVGTQNSLIKIYEEANSDSSAVHGVACFSPDPDGRPFQESYHCVCL